MDEKAARKIRLKEIYDQVNAGKGDWRIIVL
jgi:3'-phosphoadenosine 5'-phosphosulfate sulfotransferase